MQHFSLVLKNEKERLYTRLFIFILFFNTGAICWFFPITETAVLIAGGLIAILLLMGCFVLSVISSKKKVPPLLLLATAIAIVLFWILDGHILIAILSAFLFFLHRVNKRALIIKFSPAYIEYPSVPKRVILWAEISHVIIKDDWLTIDFKNNRIIQQVVQEFLNAGNEKDFNDFCREQLKK